MSTRGYIHISARYNTCVEISHGVSLYESSCLVLPERWGECHTSCAHLMQMDTWEVYHYHKRGNDAQKFCYSLFESRKCDTFSSACINLHRTLCRKWCDTIGCQAISGTPMVKFEFQKHTGLMDICYHPLS